MMEVFVSPGAVRAVQDKLNEEQLKKADAVVERFALAVVRVAEPPGRRQSDRRRRSGAGRREGDLSCLPVLSRIAIRVTTYRITSPTIRARSRSRQDRRSGRCRSVLSFVERAEVAEVAPQPEVVAEEAHHAATDVEAEIVVRRVRDAGDSGFDLRLDQAESGGDVWTDSCAVVPPTGMPMIRFPIRSMTWLSIDSSNALGELPEVEFDAEDAGAHIACVSAPAVLASRCRSLPK